MRLTDQRDVLVRASENAQASLETLMIFFAIAKVSGPGRGLDTNWRGMARTS